MKSTFKITLLTSLLALAGATYAMGPMRGDCDMAGGMGMGSAHSMQRGKMDPARMQAMMDKRHAALKAQLKLTAAQESAWTAFEQAHKMPPGMQNHQRPDPAEMAKLTTPERIEKMQTLRAERMKEMSAAMEKRTEATKAFYAALTPEQQKTFDAATLPGKGRTMGQGPGLRNGQGPMAPAKS